MRQIDLQAVIDKTRFSRLHITIIFWCTLVMVLDGYDLAIVGISLPLIMKSMHVTPAQAGLMASASLFGMMIGSVLFGRVGDRAGRKPAIIICVAIFSLFSAAAGATSGPVAFSIARFLGGLGMGGVAPVGTAQMTEFSPRTARSTLVSLMFAGYSVGGVLAAVLGKTLLESHGWQSVYLVAAIPVIFIPAMWKTLPESLSFLMARGKESDVKKILGKLVPNHELHPNDKLVMPMAQDESHGLLSGLFKNRLAISTLMFWVICITNLFTVYGLSSWLTKLMAAAGYNLGSALIFVLFLNLGAVIGAIGGGRLADRLNIRHVLIGMYLLAAVSIALLGYNASTGLRYFLVTIAGACTIGTQIVVYAYIGQFYTAGVRATGVGWASGIGRLGAAFGPILIGVIVGLKLSLHVNFFVMAIPSVISAVAVGFINHRLSASVASNASENSPDGVNAFPKRSVY
jgi:MFS transporter, AAHS family, benzoate transport protein